MEEDKTQKQRKLLYGLLGFWALILLGIFVYIQISDKKKDQLAPEQIQQQIENREDQVQEQNELESEANINASKQEAIVGEKAPEFILDGENGQVKLSDYKGEPVVVEFIATWCPHCQAMAPVYDEVMAKNKDVGYVIIGAAGEPDRTVEEWHNNFLGEPMQGDLAFDRSLEVARNYGLSGYPTSAFIDANGVLKEIYSGEMTPEVLQEKLDKIK